MCGVEIVKHRALLKPIYRFMKNTHSILRACVEKPAFVKCEIEVFPTVISTCPPLELKSFGTQGLSYFRVYMQARRRPDLGQYYPAGENPGLPTHTQKES